jgi:HIRAN domain-containing protein
MTTETIHTKVAGVSFKNPDGSSRQQHIRRHCAAFMPVILRREPDNRHDKNAVTVWVSAHKFALFQSEVQIGHLNADLAADIAHHIDHGGTVTAEITEVSGGRHGDPALGVSIVIHKR